MFYLKKKTNYHQNIAFPYLISRGHLAVIYCFLDKDNTDSQNENFFFLHEQISNFLKGHDLLVTNRPKKNFPRV